MNPFRAENKALILAAHPDDAELSVGGTIAYLRQRSMDVAVINFTTSEYTAANVKLRRDAACQAAKILDYRLIWAVEGRYNQVEEIPENQLVGLIDAFVEYEHPALVIAPWVGDSHVDHVLLARAAIASSRRWSADLYAYCPAEYRTVCFHQFEPNVFVDISPYVELKLTAIRVFNFIDQGFRRLQEDDLVQLWTYYGVLSGYKSAEGLRLIRSRWGSLCRL